MKKYFLLLLLFNFLCLAKSQQYRKIGVVFLDKFEYIYIDKNNPELGRLSNNSPIKLICHPENIIIEPKIEEGEEYIGKFKRYPERWELKKRKFKNEPEICKVIKLAKKSQQYKKINVTFDGINYEDIYINKNNPDLGKLSDNTQVKFICHPKEMMLKIHIGKGEEYLGQFNKGAEVCKVIKLAKPKKHKK